ncbi:MAG: hypothetical protein WCR36_07195, partial [Bacteroidaceae bacterium]
MKNILAIIFLVFSNSVFAINEQHFLLAPIGWSTEYQKKIMDSKNEYLSILNEDEYLKNFEAAPLMVHYNNSHPLFILNLHYNKDIIRVDNRENSVGYLSYGSNGFWSTAFESIFGKLATIQRSLAQNDEDFGLNRTIANGSLAIIINKDLHNRAIIKAYVDWSKMKIVFYTNLELILNNKQYSIDMPYASINKWGYIYGGEKKDKLSGKTNLSAIAFEKFFELSEADLRKREEEEKEQKRKFDFIEEDKELKVINDTVYKNLTPDISIDFSISKELPLRKEDSFEGNYSIVVTNKNTIISNNEDFPSTLSGDIVKRFISSVKCANPAQKEFPLHNKKELVNSTVNFNLKLYIDNVLPFPIELILKKDKKTGSVIVSNKKKITEVFKLGRCDDESKIKSLLNAFEGNEIDCSFMLNENKKTIKVLMRTYSFQYTFEKNVIKQNKQDGVFYELVNNE